MIVFGLGIGVILLIFLWVTIALFLYIGIGQSLMLKTGIVIAASLFSGLLLILPQESSSLALIPDPPVHIILDEFFITKIIVLLIASIFTIGGLGIVILHASEPMMASPLPKYQATD